jgi:hypothetical protein
MHRKDGSSARDSSIVVRAPAMADRGQMGAGTIRWRNSETIACLVERLGTISLVPEVKRGV